MEKSFSIEECCELLQKSKPTIQRYIREGKLEPVYSSRKGKPGRVRRITVASVTAYVKKYISVQEER